MTARLDRTGQRIVGVLLEKELSVPDSYPLSENALQAGCNQQSNRDPVFHLESFQIHGALLQLAEAGWVAQVEGSGRVAKFRHKVKELLGVDGPAKAVLAELLLRGPQAPGALKGRVGRMGFAADAPDAVEKVLRDLAGRPQPLVEQLPLGPRERDQRWRHLLGDVAAAAPEEDAAPRRAAVVVPAHDEGGTLADRVTALEQEVAALRARLTALERPVVRGD